MSEKKLLRGLPSRDASNFSNFKSDHHKKKMPAYLCTEDRPVEQTIVSDRNTILLRYLYQQLDKKLNGEKVPKRRTDDADSDSDAEPASSSGKTGPPRKQAKVNSELNSQERRKEKRA